MRRTTTDGRQEGTLHAPMYFVYSLLLGLGFLILSPRFVIDAFRHGKYVAGFRERIGAVSLPQDRSKPTIWLHTVSVGETQAARPLVKAIKHQFPNHSIVVSTITSTGQNLARELFKADVDKVFYFPFDWRWSVRRTLNTVNPAAVLLMETELWPGFLRECGTRGIPVAVVNGRLSDQSFRRYSFIKGFMKRVLASVDLAIMQTEADAQRLERLGMSSNKTFVAGNLKFDAGALPSSLSLTQSFSKRFSLENSPFILAASTHASEERILLKAFSEIVRIEPNTRLVFAPRHPERFNEVAALLQSSGFGWSRRSSAETPDDINSKIILLDSIGELTALYPLATIVFVGGSIANTGGHNILEPAAVGACVVTGPYTHNFRLIVDTFVAAEAIVQLPSGSETEIAAQLQAVMLDLLANPTRRKKLGEQARSLVDANLGATQRTVALLLPLLSNSSAASGAEIKSASLPPTS